MARWFQSLWVVICSPGVTLLHIPPTIPTAIFQKINILERLDIRGCNLKFLSQKTFLSLFIIINYGKSELTEYVTVTVTVVCCVFCLLMPSVWPTGNCHHSRSDDDDTFIRTFNRNIFIIIMLLFLEPIMSYHRDIGTSLTKWSPIF